MFHLLQFHSLANAIPLSTVTAKGDLIAASSSGTVTNLPVGADGTTLVADSSTSTGLRYTAGNPIPNPVLNSSFQIAQRGTSFSTPAANNQYTMDRWRVRTTAANMANVVSRQNTSDTTNLPNIQYCARVQRNSGQTGTSFLIYEQGFETINSIPFAGKTVTLSFYARAGANFSASGNVLISSLVNGTGTDQMPDIYTGGNYPTQNNTLTTTWQRFSYTLTVPTTATELGIQLYYTPTGTAGANDYFEVTGVQIDIGSVALPFRTYAGTIQGELAACQRYFYNVGAGANKPLGSSLNESTTLTYVDVYAPVTMRTAPTIVQTTGASYYLIAGSNQSGFTGIDQSTNTITELYLSTSGLTQGQARLCRSQNASGSISLSAEL